MWIPKIFRYLVMDKYLVRRFQKRVYVVIAFCTWMSLFTWMTLTFKSEQVIDTKKHADYRIVPELLIPPIELTGDEKISINIMIHELKNKGYFNEDSSNVFDDTYPKWPFYIPHGLPLIPKRHWPNPDVLTSGQKFGLGCRQFSLYNPYEFDMKQLLHEMATYPVKDLDEIERGTQLKFQLKLENYGSVLFKPQRYDRSYETSPNHFYFSDYERHNSEIAAYHLDRILGWYRAPPVIGRLFNVTSDLYQYASKKLRKTFFVSPANNMCFFGYCKYYCDTTNAFCGHPDMIEGSIATFLPPESHTDRYKIKSPWRRSYNKHKLAVWENNSTYCYYVKLQPEFSKGRRLLDIIDTHVLDYLIGNMDRHHYVFYKGFRKNNTFHLHFDHGRGFGRINHDEESILSPLTQCCHIRYTTLYKLVTFYAGNMHLSEIMRTALSFDPVSPVLAEGHYEALDRRLAKILRAVNRCLITNSVDSVIIRDGY